MTGRSHGVKVNKVDKTIVTLSQHHFGERDGSVICGYGLPRFMRLAGSIYVPPPTASVPCTSTLVIGRSLFSLFYLLFCLQRPSSYIQSPSICFASTSIHSLNKFAQSRSLSSCFHQPQSFCFSSRTRTLSHATIICMQERHAAAASLYATLKAPRQQMNLQSVLDSLLSSSMLSTPSIAPI